MAPVKKKRRQLSLIASIESFLTRSLEDRLREAGYTTEVVSPDVKSLPDTSADSMGYIIFLDGDVVSNLSVMVMLRDMVMERDVPVFLVGRPDEIVATEKSIPQGQIKGTFSRPVDINRIFEFIIGYYTFYRDEDRKTILAVDDSGTMLRSIKGLFEDKYQVMLANSAAMAIKCITLHKPDLILLDYDMPIVNGKQVLEMIRSENDFESVPVMFLTGLDDSDAARDVTMLRPEAYLLKSMPPREIRSAVDEFFMKKSYR